MTSFDLLVLAGLLWGGFLPGWLFGWLWRETNKDGEEGETWHD